MNKDLHYIEYKESLMDCITDIKSIKQMIQKFNGVFGKAYGTKVDVDRIEEKKWKLEMQVYKDER